MHRTTINVSESVFQQARIKALREDVTVSEVVRDLLARWVAGELDLSAQNRSRDRLVARARDARGMWADRDPDAYLAASRARLKERDQELTNARLDA
ncbi:MAG: hypothetical protein P8189_18125 [Anaerolineae bacterium]|jgi:hypothetical protein